jgi:hypothetical protein
MNVNTPTSHDRYFMQEYVNGVLRGILTEWTAKDYVASRRREIRSQSLVTYHPTTPQKGRA